MENLLKKTKKVFNSEAAKKQVLKLVEKDGWFIEEETENYITISRFKNLSYSELVEELVGLKYSLKQELSIQRQKDVKPEEFKEYFDYVELCKVEAKQMINERQQYQRD